MTGLELTPGDWLIVVALGTLLGLDGTSWPQTMASRPIVAGTLGGLLFGDPTSGFIVGAWLEIVTSRHPPFGGARYPETGPAGLISGAAYALSDTGSVVALVAAALAGWAIGWIGTHSISMLRAHNARSLGDPASYQASLTELVRRHRRAIRLDAVRAAATTGAFFVPVVISVHWLDGVRPGELGAAWAPTLAALGLAGLAGVGARVLGGRREGWPAFVFGGMAGLALVWLVA